MLHRAGIVSFGMALAITAGCGNTKEEGYKPAPAWSGKKANLPPVPQLPNTPVKAGDAYTVFGATHHLRSSVHNKDVTAKPITVTGYIVETNYDKAPPCAVHEENKEDPKDCTDIPLPSFWIADNKGDTKGPRIRVVGWARNYAVIVSAMKKYDTVKDGKPTEKEQVRDNILQVILPYPLPAVGAKVRITGPYGVSTRLSSDLISEPVHGVIKYEKMEFVEPAPDKAVFPQIKK